MCDLNETPITPRRVLAEGKVQCMDGALFAAAALRVQGHPPWIVDLEAVFDDDHVLAVFREKGAWGAIARSNYSGLRFRELHQFGEIVGGPRVGAPIGRPCP